MLFLKHPAFLWLKIHEKHKIPPIDDNLQAMFDTGHEFEHYVEKLYPDAIKLGFSNYNEYMSLPQRTKETLNNGASTILQGRFEAEGITCIVDILNKVDDNFFDLIEIKSSTKVKPEHEYDLAFQTLVLEKSGLKIRNIAIIHVNNEYVKKGDIEPEKIIIKTDVTNAVKNLIGITEEQIDKAFKTLSQKNIPDTSPRHANPLDIPRVKWFGDWLNLYKHNKPNLDPYSIYFLSYPNAEQIGELEDKEITLIQEVPEEMALRDRQLSQIIATRDDERVVNKEKVRKFLGAFEYPLYFFDYETFSTLIPQFDGCKPYKDYPFQYSLHILDSPGAELRHEEYLHQENTNPMPQLIEKLKEDIGNNGTVLTWNMSYEKSCNDRMANFYPEHREFFSNFNARIEDLMTPFSEMWFVDKDFYGSASLKNVLPVLVPELNYEKLDISDGLLARRVWTGAILEGKNQDKREKIVADLIEYCTLDTFAMVRILEELRKVISE